MHDLMSAYGYKRLYGPTEQHARFEALTGRFGLRCGWV